MTWDEFLREVMDAEDQNQGCVHPSLPPDVHPLFCCQWNGRTGDDMCAECRALEDRIHHAFDSAREPLKSLLSRATPVHYAGECMGACTDDEPERCGTLKLIAEIAEALKEA